MTPLLTYIFDDENISKRLSLSYKCIEDAKIIATNLDSWLVDDNRWLEIGAGEH